MAPEVHLPRKALLSLACMLAAYVLVLLLLRGGGIPRQPIREAEVTALDAGGTSSREVPTKPATPEAQRVITGCVRLSVRGPEAVSISLKLIAGNRVLAEAETSEGNFRLALGTTADGDNDSVVFLADAVGYMRREIALSPGQETLGLIVLFPGQQYRLRILAENGEAILGVHASLFWGDQCIGTSSRFSDREGCVDIDMDAILSPTSALDSSAWLRSSRVQAWSQDASYQEFPGNLDGLLDRHTVRVEVEPRTKVILVADSSMEALRNVDVACQSILGPSFFCRARTDATGGFTLHWPPRIEWMRLDVSGLPSGPQRCCLVSAASTRGRERTVLVPSSESCARVKCTFRYENGEPLSERTVGLCANIPKPDATGAQLPVDLRGRTDRAGDFGALLFSTEECDVYGGVVYAWSAVAETGRDREASWWLAGPVLPGRRQIGEDFLVVVDRDEVPEAGRLWLAVRRGDAQGMLKVASVSALGLDSAGGVAKRFDMLQLIDLAYADEGSSGVLLSGLSWNDGVHDLSTVRFTICFSGLPPQVFDVSASTVRSAIASGSTLPLTFEEPKDGGLCVKVLDEKGDPVPGAEVVAVQSLSSTQGSVGWRAGARAGRDGIAVLGHLEVPFLCDLYGIDLRTGSAGIEHGVATGEAGGLRVIRLMPLQELRTSITMANGSRPGRVSVFLEDEACVLPRVYPTESSAGDLQFKAASLGVLFLKGSVEYEREKGNWVLERILMPAIQASGRVLVGE